MESFSGFVLCLCTLACGYHVSGLEIKEDLRQKMLGVINNSERDIIPINNGPLVVNVSLELTSIREVDTVRGEVEILAMRVIKWQDVKLAWAGRQAENTINSFSMDLKHLWSPDIVAYNAVHAPELLSLPIARVSADGSVIYVPNERIRFTCNLEHFETPEGSNCTIKYGSWTYHGSEIDLKLEDSMFSTWSYQESPRYELLGTYARLDRMHYACCPEAYPDAKFTLNIRSRTNHENFFGWKK